MSEPTEKKAKTDSTGITVDTDASQRKFMIGTRKSNLAMWQAHHVNDTLNGLFPDSFDIIGISTLGDKDQMKPLTAFDQKGVFTKELDTALLGKHIDLAVHCIKDLPTVLPTGLAVGAILVRGETADCVIYHEKHKKENKSLKDLPKGAIIGTSALRRTAFITREHPHLVCKNIRGNVNTRLAKLDKGDYDAIVLATTGLRRLGMDDRIHEILDIEKYGYAVGQGALAVVVREGDTAMEQKLAALVCKKTTLECHAERVLLNTLNGGCKVPIAVRTKMEYKEDGSGSVELWAAVSTVDGKTVVEHSDSVKFSGEYSDHVEQSKALGGAVGKKMLDDGAAAILASSQDAQ